MATVLKKAKALGWLYTQGGKEGRSVRVHECMSA